MVNETAKGALTAYLGMTEPGYAILVDAPWGAGKTHFVRTICKEMCGPKGYRYASLNGVCDDRSFRRALLKDAYASSSFSFAETFGNLLGEHTKLGDLGAVARDFAEEQLVKKLPDILVFDDIERAKIDIEQLWGFINSFVEHGGKRVVLLANSTEHDQPDVFQGTSEKLIGKTVRISADFDAAFQVFISAIEEGQGKTYIRDHQHVFKSAFVQSKYDNLRIFRNAMRECALVLDRIEEDLFKAKEPMQRFARTYMAFAMALMKGEIKPEDLKRRQEIFSKRDELAGLGRLFDDFKGADIFSRGGGVFSDALGQSLFVEGHVEKHTLNASLRKSGQFIEQDENPLWRRARHWFEHGWDELSDLVEECECYLFETDPIEAGPYLHIAEAVLNIHISIWPPAENEAFKQKIIDRIRSFVGSQGVATATMGRNFGWGERVMEGEPQFSFGGYTYQIDVSTRDIINAMRDVQLELYDSEKPQILSGLMTDFQTDLAKFKERISRSIKDDTFYDVPFFHELDADEFAKAVISHLKKGHFEELGSMFERAEMRHNPSEKWAQERDWFVTVRSKLEELTFDHPPLVRAHMDKFFKSHWKFKSNAQVE